MVSLNREFIRFDGQKIIIEPAGLSKTFATQRKVIILVILMEFVTFICFAGFIILKLQAAEFQTAIFIPIAFAMVVMLIVPFLFIRLFGFLFPRSFDQVTRIMTIHSPIIKFRKNLSEIMSVVVSTGSMHGGRHSLAQQFIYAHGFTPQGKKTELIRIPGASIEDFLPHIKTLASTMGWKISVKESEDYR